jgi:hypothetical protein
MLADGDPSAADIATQHIERADHDQGCYRQQEVNHCAYTQFERLINANRYFGSRARHFLLPPLGCNHLLNTISGFDPGQISLPQHEIDMCQNLAEGKTHLMRIER